MAYPFYTNYQQYQPMYQPYVQQPVMQPTQMSVANTQPVQQATPMQNQSGIIWISSENEALSFPVAPNNAVTLWSQTEPVVYLKQADATGKPILKIYDLVERAQTASNAQIGKENNNLSAYATKDELSAVVGVVKGFDELIGGIKSDLETMKGDMYGIAGKKKIVRKPKIDEMEEEE